MATKRKPISSNPRMNFRPNIGDNAEPKGTRPTAAPTSIYEVITVMILHCCKKIILYDINIKVAIYLATVFIISFISDHAPLPRSYFSRSDNIFNLYFVKIGWLWTLLLAVPFIVLTSCVYCCGIVKQILKHHLLRIGIATAFWLTLTKIFNYIEVHYGYCKVRSFTTKPTCIKNGHIWNGFDISGHTFILIYSSLILMEEAKAIIGWESIRDHIRNEEHSRSQEQSQTSTNPLRNLKNDELYILKLSYNKFTNYIRAIFISMTFLLLLWDVMLCSTIIYYHIMIEKFIGAVIAILVWYFTYKFWYAQLKIIPDSPGVGLFKYQIKKQANYNLRKSSLSNSSNVKKNPKFMGMPLHVFKNEDQHVENTLDLKL